MKKSSFTKIALVFILVSVSLIQCKNQASNSKLNTPPYPFIDALDLLNWNGITLIERDNSSMALKIGAYINLNDSIYYLNANKDFWNMSFSKAITKVGTKDAKGNYADLSWTLQEMLNCRLQWAKIDKDNMVVKISSNPISDTIDFGLTLEFYSPYDYKNTYSFKDGIITESSSKHQIFIHEKPEGLSEFSSLSDVEINRVLNSGLQQVDNKEVLVLSFKERNEIHIQISKPAAKTIKPGYYSKYFEEKEKYVLNNRVKLDGRYRDLPSAILNPIYWTINYIPNTDILYIPAGRAWVGENWRVFCWDTYFNALESSLDNSFLGLSNITAVHRGQYPDGMIPSSRRGEVAFFSKIKNDTIVSSGTEGFSQPPIGSFVTWKLYNKYGLDETWLEEHYLNLKKWYLWWNSDSNPNKSFPNRDGNGNGLFEWGVDQDFEAIHIDPYYAVRYESGLDDSPLWDSVEIVNGHMNMDCLDLNCLRAMDAEMLAKIAEKLNIKDDVVFFTEEYNQLKKLINNNLWDENKGFYFSKYWSGEFNHQKAAVSFYPLLAGIADNKQADLLVQQLTDTNIFWDENLLPTISKDNPAYRDQQYWRGTAWPPTNYLVYQGLKRYGYDSVASVYAEISADMYLNNPTCRENYNTITGLGEGRTYQSWGPLMGMLLIEEHIDLEPWAWLRIGSLNPKTKRIEEVWIDNNNYRVDFNHGMKVYQNNKEIINTSTACVLRVLRKNKAGTYECEITSLKKGFLTELSTGKKTEYSKGKSMLNLDFFN